MANRGFTFIELAITLAILGVLALMALPAGPVHREAREGAGAADGAPRDPHRHRRIQEGGRRRARAAQGRRVGVPAASLDLLVEGVVDPKDPSGKQRFYFLRRMPRDPMVDDPALPASRTWSLRSYESPYDAPRAGRDVFDVYSTSDGVGLNGIPYRQW